MNRTIVIFLFVILVSVNSAISEASWVKYVSPDRKISFHYPQGWKVNQQKTFIEIANLSSDEQMMMLLLPFDANKSPAELANYMIEAYRGDMPDFKASNYQDMGDGKGGGTVFEISSTNQGKTYRGNVFVLKTDNKAFWYQYTSPAQGYSPERAFTLLNGLITSMDSGPNSQPPADLVQGRQQPMTEKPSPEVLERNAQAFLFILEFALGAPFTQEQEKQILHELKRGWETQSAEEIKQYDELPLVADVIMKMQPNDIEDYRKELEKSTREWLAESKKIDRMNPAVRIIEAQLNRKGKVLIQGNPPLTEMAANAYCEMIAYSVLLQTNMNARPEQISGQQVAENRKQLLEIWNRFSVEDRKNITTAPGVWISVRKSLQYGTQAEQQQIRANIRQLMASPEPPQNEQVITQREPQRNVVPQQGVRKITCDEYLGLTLDQQKQIDNRGGVADWTDQDWAECRKRLLRKGKLFRQTLSTQIGNWKPLWEFP